MDGHETPLDPKQEVEELVCPEQGKCEEQQQMDAEAAKNEAGSDVKQEAAVQISDDEIRKRLAVLLAASDLSVTTEKMLRKRLEDDLGVKLADKKAVIREEVMAYLDQKREEEGDGQQEEAKEEEEAEDEEQEQKPTKKRGGGGFTKELLLSEPLQEFMGLRARPGSASQLMRDGLQVVKAVWDYVKANNLQNPKDKREIIVDEKLGKVFTPPMNMFSMNKQIAAHVFNPDEVVDGDSAPQPKPVQAAAAKKGKKRARKGSDDDNDDDDDDDFAGGAAAKKKRGGGGGGFAKPIPISDELAAAVGEKEISRGALTKWIYAYAKEKDLMDPCDKRFVLADETLEKLTGEKRFKAFGAGALFKNHFIKK
eukprot:gene13688-13810_t